MIPQHYFEQLINRLENDFMLLSTPFKIFLRSILSLSYAKSGTLLAKKGQLQEDVTFILEGSAEQQGPIKYFQKKKNADYSVIWFWIRNDFVFSIPGFFSRRPAVHNVILREDSVILQLSFVQFINLKTNYPETEILIELVRDHYQNLMVQRLKALSHSSYGERYEKFKKDYRIILYSSSIYKLADYLGMSYRSFTRLHNRR